MKGGEPGRTEGPVWSACHHGQSRGSGLCWEPHCSTATAG